MTEKQSYTYTVLRYVHDVVSGEALNVGVVMHVQSTGLLEVRTRKTVGRLKQAFPDLDRQGFVEAMKAVDRGLRAASGRLKHKALSDRQFDARIQALQVLPEDDSALQWSPVGSGLTTNPAKTFENLYQRYVAQYDRTSERRRTDEDVWRPVRGMLAARNVNIPFEHKVVASEQDQIEFKKAWKNGEWHAYEPLSLDLADADNIKDKARRWRGHLSAVAEGFEDDIKLHFVVGRPQAAALMPAYESAKEILKGARFEPEVVDEHDVDDFVAALEVEYRNHMAQKSR